MFKRVQIDSTNLKTILGMVYELFEAINSLSVDIDKMGVFFIVFSKFLNITLLFYFILVQQLKKSVFIVLYTVIKHIDFFVYV